MKKLIIKLSILLLVLFVGVSLSACTDKSDSDSYNKKPAYGDLSSETNYATLGNLSISIGLSKMFGNIPTGVVLMMISASLCFL